MTVHTITLPPRPERPKEPEPTPVVVHAKRTHTRRRDWKHRPIHANRSQCSFPTRGIKHASITTIGTEHFIDITRVQMCACGERLVTRLSRTLIPEAPD
jgi:hypothetical protein